MPYYRCPSCGLTSYSAAHSAVTCATCAADLPTGSRLHVALGSPPIEVREALVAVPADETAVAVSYQGTG